MEQKTYGHVEVKLHGFLTSAVVGSKWRVSHLGEIVSGTNGLGWVEPTAGVDGVEKRQNPCTSWNQSPVLPYQSLVAVLNDCGHDTNRRYKL
jgi:hypothetical protein